MKIGIAGPIETELLTDFLGESADGAPRGLGGISVTQLVRGLLLEGYDVSVYTLDERITTPVICSGEKLKIYYGCYRPRHRMRDFMRIERNHVQRFIEMDRPDLVHAHWTYEFALGALASRRPTLITVRDWAPAILHKCPDMYRLGRLAMNFVTLLRGRQFVAVSPYIQREIQFFSRLTVPVVPNAIEDVLFERSKAEMRRQDPVIISVNNGFGKLKNVHVLLQAFRLIRTEIPDCRLRLIGTEFGAGEQAEQWAQARGLTQGIECVGYVPSERAFKEIGEADLLIHPSLEESFGNTLLEAMANGVPVIGGSKSGAVPWVLGEGKAGVLTDVTDPAAIARHSISLLKDPKQWRQTAEAGYQYAWDNFRLSHITARYLELYYHVLNRRPIPVHESAACVK